MKVKCLGTGTLTTSRALTSFLIDGEILFDIGGGVITELKKYNIDTSKITKIVISHYHSDHIFDLAAYLVRRSLRNENNDGLTIVGPVDIEDVVGKIRDICSSGLEQIWDFQKMNLKFAGLENEEIFSDDQFTITAYAVKHAATTPNNGYTVERDGTTLGFSGDATKSDGLNSIVEKSDVVFIDSNGPAPDPSGFHLGLSGALEYAAKYPDKKFYLIHRGDYELPELPNNVFAPNDGEEIEI